MEIFLHPNILQTDLSKFLLKIKFRLRFRLYVSNNFGSTGSEKLLFSWHICAAHATVFPSLAVTDLAEYDNWFGHTEHGLQLKCLLFTIPTILGISLISTPTVHKGGINELKFNKFRVIRFGQASTWTFSFNISVAMWRSDCLLFSNYLHLKKVRKKYLDSALK